MKVELPSRILLALVLIAAPVAASCQVTWAELSAEERQMLAPWSERWSQLGPGHQDRLRANARHWITLDPKQREALELRMREWDALPPEQRARVRERFDASTAPDSDRGGCDVVRRYAGSTAKRAHARDEFERMFR